MLPQVEDLGQGNFGFVQKAIGNINIDGHIIPREVAIKFIARGSTVRRTSVQRVSCRMFSKAFYCILQRMQYLAQMAVHNAPVI